MARFVGKERDVGSELLGRLLAFIVLLLLILVVLTIWHPLWAQGFLTALGLWDIAVNGLGR